MTIVDADSRGQSARGAEDMQRIRLAAWQSPEGRNFASPAVAELYRQRTQRFVDIINLRQPDRVPSIIYAAGIVARYAGITFAEAYYDIEKSVAASLNFVEEFRPEYTVMLGGGPLFGRVFDLLGYQAYKWPGGALPPDVSFQYVENEYMPPEDYDALINDPEGYMLRSYLPRVCTQLAGLRQIPSLITTVEMLGVSMWLAGLGAPPVREALTRLAQAAEQVGQGMARLMQAGGEMVARFGCPDAIGGFAKAPFDSVADTLRGTRGALLDLRRRPDKLQAASEALVPTSIRMGVGASPPGAPPLVVLPLHKGAVGFMSFKQFEKFYWPTLERVLEGIIAAGLVPLLFVEGSYDEARLAHIAASGLPAGRTVWAFDRTDLRVVRKHFNGFACFGGNVPISLFRAGTPAEMEDYCKRLIDDVAPGGGFFLASGAVVDDADPAVVRAYLGAAEKFGAY
jgi:uroporphyrinogen-III decarboxylase